MQNSCMTCQNEYENELLASIDTEQHVGNSTNYTQIESEISKRASRHVATDRFINIPSDVI